jgi:hypothetical protein
VAALVLALATSACSSGTPDLGFALALTLDFDGSVSDSALHSVTSLKLVSSGDESYTTTLPLNRPAKRVERLVYLPLPTTSKLDVVVVALDASSKLVAAGSADLTLVAGQTTPVTIQLSAGGVTDLGADLRPVDLAHDDLSTPSYFNSVMAHSPLAYYRLDEQSGTVAHDSSGNGLDGQYGEIVTHTSGIVAGSSGAASFVGGAWNASAIINVPRSVTLEPSAAVTVEAWIRPSLVSSSDSPGIVSYGPDTSPFEPYILQLYQGSPSFYVAMDAGSSVGGTTLLDEGTIYHLVGVYNGASLTLYVNGGVAGSVPYNGSIANYDGILGLAIGATVTANDGPRTVFPGVIDEVAIYGTALDLTAIQEHYMLGMSP